VSASEVVDLFAGPGGWDVAAQALGLDPLGVEFDTAACLTREAAGLRTVRADVSRPPLRDDLALSGLIASPPCQTFSMAGKGNGRKALDQVLAGVARVAAGEPIPYGEYEDIRTGLVLEPLAWALRHEPEWLAWEQVPTVLPVWEACAQVLRADGYSVAVGVLHAEEYGVPQTRKRAVLVASRTRAVSLPTPTHTRYRKGKPRQDDSMAGLLPWVSMADALGWGEVTVRRNYGTGGDASKCGERGSDEPAATVTGKVDRNIVLRNNTSANAAERATDEPSPTLYFGARMNGVYWQSVAGGPRATRDDDQPSVTAWIHERPATTVQGDPRLAEPGHRCMTNDCHAGRVAEPMFSKAVRVTVQEAAVLQSFPADYPWQGTKTKQYQQVGNAIPPLLALHVLMAATGLGVVAQAGEVAA
jgi:DNA (cytosine-5)-methyltransferase 1